MQRLCDERQECTIADALGLNAIGSDRNNDSVTDRIAALAIRGAVLSRSRPTLVPIPRDDQLLLQLQL